MPWWWCYFASTRFAETMDDIVQRRILVSLRRPVLNLRDLVDGFYPFGHAGLNTA